MEITIKEFLEDLANKSSSTDEDSAIMQDVLRRVGFKKARCVLGIVYLEGKGTLQAPPASVHTMARVLLIKAEEQKEQK